MEDMKEMVKEAFRIAEEAYDGTIGKHSGAFSYPGPKSTAIAPMAAEIYRQLTRLVIVTVKERKVTNREVTHMRDVLMEAGYRGVINVGDMEYKFPEDEHPVEVTIEMEEARRGNDS